MNSPTTAAPEIYRFGKYELSAAAGELCMDGRPVKLQPQPLKLLVLLVRRAGSVVTRDEIRQELWPAGTYVDFDQAVNFSIKQVRDVLKDAAERPLYIETVPRRGYRFIAPVELGRTGSHGQPLTGGSTARLQKALWQNVAELRLEDARRRRATNIALAVLGALLLLVLALLLIK